MGTTTRGLTYPASTDVPNVPADLQTLAQSIEAVWDGQPFCWCQHNVVLTHTTSTWTATPFDTENNDNGSMHSTSSNQSRLIAPKAGLYLFVANAAFAANSTGTRGLQVRKNAAGNAANGTQLSYQIAVTPTVAWAGAACGIVQMAINDYLEMFTFQSSGGNLNSIASTSGNAFQSLTLVRFA